LDEKRSIFAKSKNISNKKINSNPNLNSTKKNQNKSMQNLKNLKKNEKNEKNENIMMKRNSLPAISKPQQKLNSVANHTTGAKPAPISEPLYIYINIHTYTYIYIYIYI
jgi:hypothetical protein